MAERRASSTAGHLVFFFLFKLHCVCHCGVSAPKKTVIWQLSDNHSLLQRSFGFLNFLDISVRDRTTTSPGLFVCPRPHAPEVRKRTADIMNDIFIAASASAFRLKTHQAGFRDVVTICINLYRWYPNPRRRLLLHVPMALISEFCCPWRSCQEWARS